MRREDTQSVWSGFSSPIKHRSPFRGIKSNRVDADRTADRRNYAPPRTSASDSECVASYAYFTSPLYMFIRKIRNESGSEFQTVGPATEKARRCQMCCDETAEYSVCDGWPNGNAGSRKLRRLARSSRRGRPTSERGALNSTYWRPRVQSKPLHCRVQLWTSCSHT